VTFAGPGGLNGGAVLSDGSRFGITNYSSPSFLAFNNTGVMSDGGIPRGPETILFATPMSLVRLLAGTGLNSQQTVKLSAYDASNALIASVSIPLSGTMAPIQVTGDAIRSVVISTVSPTLVVDDFTFVPACATPQIMKASVRHYAGGQCGFTVSGAAGTTYQIEVSSDLRNWTLLKTVSMTNTTAECIDTNTNLGRRFYRATLLP
jgi:hypothetical protein